MTEYEKMLAGEPYNALDEELVRLRTRAHELCRKYNQLPEVDFEGRYALLRQLLRSDIRVFPVLQGGFYCHYGKNMHLGDSLNADYNFFVDDAGGVYIGDNVIIGPNVSLYTTIRSLNHTERRSTQTEERTPLLREWTKPVHIGSDTWLCGDVIVMPGVTIGSRCVISAGSVVSQDIPDDSVAAGNPCRVIHNLKS